MDQLTAQCCDVRHTAIDGRSPGLHVFRTAAPIGASSAFPTRSRSSRSSRRCHARRANAFAARRGALRHGMTIRDPGRGHPPAFAVHPGRPTDIGRTRASPMHAVVQNEPDRSDGTESRSLTSPRSAAKRIPWQVGDSCLQHGMLRFGLFSFSCPRLRYIRPTEAIAGPTAPAIALTAHTTMQGAHHASCRKAARAHQGPRAGIVPRQKARMFRN